MNSNQKVFDNHVAEWRSYVQSPLGVIRQELTRYVLANYMLKDPRIERVLDAGCGLGDSAGLWLDRGCEVFLCDYAPAMVGAAREILQGEYGEGNHRLHFIEAPVQDLAGRFDSDFFDLILCHTLLEYAEDPRTVVNDLVPLLRPAGFFSCMVTNRFSEAFQLALRDKDPVRAAEALEEKVFTAGVFQNMRRRAFSFEEVEQILVGSGLISVGKFGVRIFADFFSKELQDGECFAKVLDLERRALDKEPYRQMARYLLVIAQKGEELVGGKK